MSWLDSFFSKGYQVIQAAGVALPSESILNFTNSSVVTDDPTTGSTNVAFTLLTAPTGTGIIHVVSGVIQNPAEPISLSADVTGTLAIANGGTGLNSVGTSGYVLTSTGTAASWEIAQAGITQLTGDVTAGAGSGSVAATVVKIHGSTVPIGGSLTTGNILQVSGTAALSYGPLNLAGGSNYITGIVPDANLPTPTGDWTGTIDSNSVVKIHGTSVPAGGSLVVGNGLYVSNSSALAYGPLNLAGGSGYVENVLPIANLPSLAGDVTGAITSNSVVKLQGVAVSNSSPTNGQALVYTNSSTHWIATSPAGDLTGSTFLATYVGTISGVGGAGGTIEINATTLTWAAGQSGAGLAQAAATGAAANMTIAAQASTGGEGGTLVLQSGPGNTTANTGQIEFNIGTENVFEMGWDADNEMYAISTSALGGGQGAGVYRTANSVTALSCSGISTGGPIPLIGTFDNAIVIGDSTFLGVSNVNNYVCTSAGGTPGYNWSVGNNSSSWEVFQINSTTGNAFDLKMGPNLSTQTMFEIYNASGGTAHRVVALCQMGAGLSGSNAPTGDGVVWIGNAQVNPSSDPTGGGILYVSGGALWWLGSSGTSTKIANA